MCGICGIVGVEDKTEAALHLRRMMLEIRHRGPDESGATVSPRAAIGSQRLSILDVPGGRQPMWNPERTLGIVFNGEIYNCDELRRDLRIRGLEFQTHSDTEVILHSYQNWGEECVRHLRGMFAFAILEMRGGQPERLFLARDRLGIKPLYYGYSGDRFLFASEVRALLSSGLFPLRICKESVMHYLQFGSVCEPLTMVEGIVSLLPGYCAVVRCSEPSRPLAPKPYWGIADITPERQPPKTSASKELRTRLEEVVRSHLQADVDVGIFLSGGMDSTALASVASREREGIRTISVGFPEEGFSEAEIARATAKRLHTQHTELMLTGQEALASLEDVLDSFDQPGIDGVNTYFVSWAARQAGLKVALSGLGSDEIFGGYPTFQSTPRVGQIASISRRFPAFLRTACIAAVKPLIEHGSRADAWRKLASAVIEPQGFPHPYFFTRTLFPRGTVRQLMNHHARNMCDSGSQQWLQGAAEDAASMDSFNAISWLEVRTYLLNMLLHDTDCMSMRHSLEIRVPFLDHRLIEFVISLPAEQKCRDGFRKSLLAESLSDCLPSEILRTPKKVFALPWDSWLRGALRGRIESALLSCDQSLGAIIHTEEVAGIWRNFLARRTSWSRPWSLFVLSEWLKRNLQTGRVAADKNADRFPSAEFGRRIGSECAEQARRNADSWD